MCADAAESIDRIAVLISGRGSNLGALVRATQSGALRARIALVISNRADAGGLEIAVQAGIDTAVMPHRSYADREHYDRALLDTLHRRQIRLVCLAGFMRLLGPAFCEALPLRVLNVHPSLLPAFPGVDAQRQAFEHGVKMTGATVHFVTSGLDEGPIVDQEAVGVADRDTVETLAARILEAEHRIYARAVDRVLHGRWRLVGRRVLFDDSPSPAGAGGDRP